MNLEDKPCNQHPDAPHGFDRNASHNAGRYVCECEGWEPVAVQELDKKLSRQEGQGCFDTANKIVELQAKITEQAAEIEQLESTINKLLGQLEDAYAGLAGEDY